MHTFTILLLVFLTSTLTGQTLTIKIQNKTGHKIDSLIVATKYIGTIEKDSTIGPIQFAEFEFDSGWPYVSISGQVGEKHLKNELLNRCGSERSVEVKGEYLFVLTISQNGNKEYLLLQ